MTQIVNFEIPEQAAEPAPSFPFQINGEDFRFFKPKMMSVLPLLSVLDLDEERMTLARGVQLAQALWGIVQYIEDVPPEPTHLPDPDWTPAPAQPEAERPPLITTDPNLRGRLDPDWVPRPAQTEADRPAMLNPRAGKLRGRARIQQRLSDPRDQFDIVNLSPVARLAMTAMFPDRPTGPSLES